MELHLTRPLAFIDLETTGTQIATDRIVEISVVKVLPGSKTNIFTRLINPEIPIPPQATEFHGITDEMVRDAPTFSQIAGELNAFLNNCDLAGYNSNKLDIPMLVEEFLRAGIDFDLKGRRLIDVQNIFHKMEPRTLAAAYQFYCNKPLENHHSAEADALATYEILRAMLDRYQGVTIRNRDGQPYEPVINDVDALSRFSEMYNTADLAGHLVYDENGREVFNFGKYKGRPVEEIFQKEPAYYDWMMKASFPLSTKKVITAIRLRSFNKGSVNI